MYFKIPLYQKARQKSLKLSDIESNKNLGLLRFSGGGGNKNIVNIIFDDFYSCKKHIHDECKFKYNNVQEHCKLIVQN